MSKLIIPKVIGHRGARAYAPENTLASIHAAADMGIEWVEFDVKLTKDEVPIVFHDRELNRCTNGSGLVAETDFKTIEELDAGSWFGESFIGEKIPTLEEALNLIIDLNLGACMEIKSCPGREVETAESALDVATRIWPDDVPPPLISSFSHVSLETAMDVMQEWPRSFLIEEDPSDIEYIPDLNWLEIVKHVNSYTINFDGRYASRAQIKDYLDYGRPLIAYTIDDPAKARELLDLGVSSIISNKPDVIRDEIESVH